MSIEPIDAERISDLLAQRDELLEALVGLRAKSLAFGGRHSSGYLNEDRIRHDAWMAMYDACEVTEALIRKVKEQP